MIPASSFGKVLKYHRRVPIDSDLVRGGQYCGAILVHLESGDFFEGLEVRKTQVGQQFLKGSQPVGLFPRELNIIVRVVTSRCVGPPDPRQFQPDFSFDMKFVSSLRFEGFWQRGLERRNLDLGLFSSGESGRDSFENHFRTNAWEYVLKIKCPDVPLTDTLVIQILSADGKRVSRIFGKAREKDELRFACGWRNQEFPQFRASPRTGHVE